MSKRTRKPLLTNVHQGKERTYQGQPMTGTQIRQYQQILSTRAVGLNNIIDQVGRKYRFTNEQRNELTALKVRREAAR
jgi:hypothetical protein